MATKFDPLNTYNSQSHEDTLNRGYQNSATNYPNSQLPLESVPPPEMTPPTANKQPSFLGRTLPGSYNRLLSQNSTPLRIQLLQTILPAVLVPLGLAGLVTSGIISGRSQEQTEQLLQNEALLTSDLVTELLAEAEKIPAIVAHNPLVINAAKNTATVAQTEGLPTIPIEQLEQTFATNKIVQPNSALNAYLQKTAEVSEFSELFFTDKHGFNVAYSRPTSDFVQRDEQWWQATKTGENRLIEPTFDQSANTFGIELSQAITDPNSGEFLGVVKGVLPATAFGTVLNNLLSDLHLVDSQIVQLLALTQEGNVTVIHNLGIQDGEGQQTVVGGDAIAQGALTFLCRFF